MKKASLTCGLALLAVLIVTAVAGCGGDDEGYVPDANTSVTVASPPITKPQFTARANKFCREAWTTIRDNWDVYTGGQDRDLSRGIRFEEAVRLSLLAGIVFHIFDKIRFLGAPPDEEDEIEAIIGSLQVSAELGQKERWRARSVPEVTRQFREFNRLAQSNGLDDCLVDDAHLSGIKV
jgi:hypothetical protein